MMLKFVYGFNWFCIGLLVLFVLVLLLDPNRNGGDAATKGIGSGLIAAAIIAIVILLGLNLSPWAWTRYVPPGLVLLAIVYFFAASGINILSSQKREKAIQNQPYFTEPAWNVWRASLKPTMCRRSGNYCSPRSPTRRNFFQYCGLPFTKYHP
ncbi:MAG: hypothetical protein IPH12_08625 [Saprospirales bacterium]|nr:hypothetical protein [Saprospirales bacterium]